MQILLVVLHVLVSVLLMVVVLVQSGRSGGLSGIFGSGGGDAIFSAPSGTSFLRKTTIGLASAFMLTSLTLTYLAARRGLRTVTRGLPPLTQTVPAPAAAGPEAGTKAAPDAQEGRKP